MSQNLNQLVALISVAQSTAADVAISGGQMFVSGAPAINISRVTRTSMVGCTYGNPKKHTLTHTSALAAGEVYEGTITQVASGRTYTGSFSYEVPASVPSDTVFYAAIEDLIQALIDGGQLIGTVTSSSGGTVFTPSIYAPVPNVNVSSNFTDTPSNAVTVTAAGSSFSTGVLTSGAATGAVTGKLYRITFSGVTSTDAANFNGLTFFAKATSSTAFYIYGVDPSSTVTTTGATMTVVNDGNETLQPAAYNVYGANNGTLNDSVYVPTNANFGVNIEYEGVAAMEEGPNLNQLVLIDGTQSTNANANTLFRAIIAGLNGSTPADALNTVQPL